jgi:uncharacterized protein YndB with AHSA1/START domain
MIRRQVVVPVSPERLWHALTDPDEVVGWFGAHVEWELREGAPARFWGEDGSRRLGRVEAVRPGRHLRFRWWPAPGAPTETGPRHETGNDPGAGKPGEAGVSEVSYILEPDHDGTRLTVQERQVTDPRTAGPQARAGVAGAVGAQAPGGRHGPDQERAWSPWDDRLAGAWVTLMAPATRLVRG